MKKLINALLYYKDLRLENLSSPKYRHLLLLLFWPIFGAVFLILERVAPILWESLTGMPMVYYEVASRLDSHIPFCELFVIPYYFWFAFLVGMLLYGLLFEIAAFQNYMRFVIVTYSATAIIYLLFPNMQMLRPGVFPRENLLTAIVGGLYAFDTNTNVCPSIHVLGSVAVCLAGLHSKRLKSMGWRLFFIISALLISLSTVFLKQHSIIDVFAALVLSAVAYPLVYILLRRKRYAKGEKYDALLV